MTTEVVDMNSMSTRIIMAEVLRLEELGSILGGGVPAGPFKRACVVSRGEVAVAVAMTEVRYLGET